MLKKLALCPSGLIVAEEDALALSWSSDSVGYVSRGATRVATACYDDLRTLWRYHVR